ncbi:Panacea domain-containing protein [Vagococcus entomophilus]|uniref:Antitoxin SocA-like Panacea domain-containing protein n=1 Tax=Vagococcus entomophilus TaxID=1160095 RepID=A0A430AK42_9ENTE|nr:type II toxin-antitoxin system antitoxin SocA domain-containing protein [Vagococcus entomophilus]RSU08419.1 hypothetical protein CBF30_04050 [Vagococcus entomophilus]
MEKKVVFEKIEDLIAHLKNVMRTTSPLRLQKTLYFLYAFYGATYGKICEEQNTENGRISEMSTNYPKKLFAEEFEAWEYGPVIRKVYTDNKNGKYDNLEDNTDKYQDDEMREIMGFIDDLVGTLNKMTEFDLVDRTHEDKAWKTKFDREHKYASPTIDSETLINEYYEKLNAASAI